MRIGVPREIKNHEYRVGLTPAGVHAFVEHGHQVMVEVSAGVGSGIEDEAYLQAGAQLIPTPEEIYAVVDMVIKVKEPLPSEFGLLRQDQIIYTYLHLAPAPDLTQALMESGCVAIAYETVQLADGSLPLLTPMSEVAGRLAVQAGAHHLEKAQGGRGQLLSGVPGTPQARWSSWAAAWWGPTLPRWRWVWVPAVVVVGHQSGALASP